MQGVVVRHSGVALRLPRATPGTFRADIWQCFLGRILRVYYILSYDRRICGHATWVKDTSKLLGSLDPDNRRETWMNLQNGELFEGSAEPTISPVSGSVIDR